ncbi:hypothetical protein C5F48_22415 [Cereibacter changlensis JA139]|uniref:Uncharacterized protein n=1 Tax=Cereibacter changlensis JA139 TaxID=1188249 RepID=A0A2T4JNR0_9RHOB|nr:hypothetical protein C5F48_22415 [Cereibacter changlensis JA139]
MNRRPASGGIRLCTAGRSTRTKREQQGAGSWIGLARRLLSIWLPRLASDASLQTRPVEGRFALTLRSGASDHQRSLDEAAARPRPVSSRSAKLLADRQGDAEADDGGRIAAAARDDLEKDRVAPDLQTDEGCYVTDVEAEAPALSGIERRAGEQADLGRCDLEQRQRRRSGNGYPIIAVAIDAQRIIQPRRAVFPGREDARIDLLVIAAGVDMRRPDQQG